MRVYGSGNPSSMNGIQNNLFKIRSYPHFISNAVIQWDNLNVQNIQVTFEKLCRNFQLTYFVTAIHKFQQILTFILNIIQLGNY